MADTPGRAQGSVLKYELLLLLMSFIWGTTFVAQEIGGLRGIAPHTFNALRFALGALMLIPLMRWRRNRRPRHEGDHFPWAGSVLCGLFLFAAAGFQQVGIQYTTSAHAGFITTLYILFVPLIGLVLGHRAPASLWGGIVVCLIGLYLLSGSDDFALVEGDLLILVCAVFWAFQILMVERVTKMGDSVQIAALQFVVCAMLSLAAALTTETISPVALRAGAGAVAYAGVLSVGVAFTLQVVCQKRCPAAPAAVIMSLESVFAALAGYVVLDQALTARALVGCALLFAGVLFVQLVPIWRKRREKRLAARASTDEARPI